MPNQPLTSNRYVNQLLTDASQIYSQSSEKFVAHKVFGRPIEVSKKTGNYPVFTKEYWLRNAMQRRSPGGFAAEGGYGIDLTNSYLCEVFAEFLPLSNQDEATSDFDDAKNNAQFLTDQAMLNCEIEFAAAFMATGVWNTDVTPSTKWDATGATVVKNIRAQCSVIETLTGHRPNTFVAAQRTYDTIQDAEDVVERIKHVSGLANPQVTDAAVASALGLKNFFRIGATNVTSNEGASTTVTAQVADRDMGLLCYVGDDGNPKMPSAGRMFVWKNLNPGSNEFGAAIKDYYSKDRSAHITEVEQAFDFKVTASDLGCLFYDTHS